MDAVAESERNLVSKHDIDDSAWSLRMSVLTRDRTAKPVARDEIFRRERAQGKVCSCSANHEQDWQG